MPDTSKFPLILLSLVVLLGRATSAEEKKALPAASPQDIEYFEKKIRPILAEHCYSCHSSSAKTVHGGLKVDSAQALYAGGDSGASILPGKPEESLLIAAILYDSDADYQMPPKGKLPESEIAELTEWVRRGAPFPDDGSVETAKQEINMEEARKFWSFQPVHEQPLPTTSTSSWPQKRLDHFVLSAMEKQGLSPSPEADRATLLRRLSFDLIGLPPTPEEIASFVNNPAPDAYEKEVERLLANPHFGERWGRMWLDLARYTDKTASWLDSTGQAYLYRDWVIKAMNDDVPYDDFIHRQLATDFMEETGPEDSPALGFLGLSPNYWKELKLPSEIIKVIVADEWEERVDAVSRTFLGLTVACARCHDHKFDPVTQEDYYALAGVFASTRIYECPTIEEELYAPVRVAREEVKGLEKKLTALKKKKPKPEDEIAELTEKIEDIKNSTPHYNSVMAPGIVEEALFVERKGKTPQEGTNLVYRPEPRDLNLFIRGNPNRLGDVVPRRFLEVLSNENSKPFTNGSGRLELAQSITRESAPLAARVMVNRIWLAHFGRGIVNTPSNFGLSGERPSHPELLDDLAARFIQNGWSLKKLHREIVLSSTYRQSSRIQENQESVDPENIWLSRMNRQRLHVESWRDAMLSTSGELDLTMGGPSKDLKDPKNLRRTIYGTIHRRDMSTMLLMHDFPDPTTHNPQRLSTTTALQGLYVLNGPLLLGRSEKFAERLATEIPDDDSKRIRRAYELLYARKPTPKEIEIGLTFLNQPDEVARAEAWTQYAHVLLASNEFLFVD
ncbi:Planctomycete cytochrome C [Thalassoglobus polymorphus]|uniref:Planctomycete cytochrome C n=2 Tax=Thalassoglobus polymorphus TaxID=2527994 RepID=A0A517QTN2_9PLAN|nr:Planctomycete cytochrome C [Thalassoglobus polymorphus]